MRGRWRAVDVTLAAVTVVWIVRYLENKTEAYGAIGTSLALLLWAFVLGRILTGSAVLNAALWFRHTQQA